jgi:hypothetical protein
MLPQLVAGRNYCHVVSAEQATVFFCTLLVMLCGAYLHAAVLACSIVTGVTCSTQIWQHMMLSVSDVSSGGSQSVTVVINALVTLLCLGGCVFCRMELGYSQGAA